MNLRYEDVIEVIQRGVWFDIAWTMSEPECLDLRFGFEESSHFFSIRGNNTEYVELPAGLSISGGLVQASLSELASLVPKWGALTKNYEGVALVLWESQAPLHVCPDDERFVVVAREFTYSAGPQWASLLDGLKGRP